MVLVDSDCYSACGLHILKGQVGGAWMKKQKEKKDRREKNMEDED